MMKTRKLTTGRKGFTLIELLVVIAIIAILAAILFPVFNKARARAQATMCLSNMKQVALAQQLYLADHDQTFPPWYTFKAGYEPILPWLPGSVIDIWPTMLFAYIEDPEIFVCPSVAPNKYAFDANSRIFWLDYGDPPFSSGKKPLNMLHIKQPTKIPLMWDSDEHYDQWNIAPGCYHEFGHVVDGQLAGATSDRHNGGFNVSFISGHAKWFSKKPITDIFDATGWGQPDCYPPYCLSGLGNPWIDAEPGDCVMWTDPYVWVDFEGPHQGYDWEEDVNSYEWPRW